jgi:AcrR family transcriptional regulator
MSEATPGPLSSALPSRDGRDLRWQGHREQRRVDLVDATIRAIRDNGAAVGMDEIAAAAGTSKTVIYRLFGDKAGLYRAVADRIDERVFRHVSAALARPAGHESGEDGQTDPSRVVASTVDAYLSVVEADPEVYRFVVSRPLVGRALPDDPVEATTDRVVELLVRAFPTSQTSPDVARTWALALVGAVHAVADDWLLTPARPPREVLVATLTQLAWHGLAPVLGPTPTP